MKATSPGVGKVTGVIRRGTVCFVEAGVEVVIGFKTLHLLIVILSQTLTSVTNLVFTGLFIEEHLELITDEGSLSRHLLSGDSRILS